jgi:glucokinase
MPAVAALDLFIDLYGAWWAMSRCCTSHAAGSMWRAALPHILQDQLRSPRFMAAAAEKGRMRGVVERTPIFLVTCNRMGLQGAIATGLAQPLRRNPDSRATARVRHDNFQR